MAGIHQVAHGQPVGRTNALRGMKRALNFTDDMPGAAVNHGVHFAPGAFQAVGVGIAQ
jgi:hypothetical protein